METLGNPVAHKAMTQTSTISEQLAVVLVANGTSLCIFVRVQVCDQSADRKLVGAVRIPFRQTIPEIDRLLMGDRPSHFNDNEVGSLGYRFFLGSTVLTEVSLEPSLIPNNSVQFAFSIPTPLSRNRAQIFTSFVEIRQNHQNVFATSF
jgi:hypothetical protein